MFKKLKQRYQEKKTQRKPRKINPARMRRFIKAKTTSLKLIVGLTVLTIAGSLLGFASDALSKTKNVTPFGFNKPMDYILLIVLILAYVLPTFYFIKYRLRGKTVTQYAMTYLSVLAVSLIPVIFFQPKTSVGGVKTFLTQLQWYFWIYFIATIIGYIFSLYLLRTKIVKEEKRWYAVLALLPYAGYAYMVTQTFASLHSLMNATNFSPESVYQMLSYYNSNVAFLSDSPYQTYAMLALVMLLLVLYLTLRFLYKKLDTRKEKQLSVIPQN